MVPVLDKNRKPLMPCSEKRARTMMKKKEAKPFWQKGLFCIILTKDPSNRQYQEVALGLDIGSKREGYTVITNKAVVINITTNTPDWVKVKVETRKNIRRTRRQRKTPYRACRENRATLRKSMVPPSTKARWDAKFRIINLLNRILPISHINIEDIQAASKKGKTQWNVSFSPLEVGKNYFYNTFAVTYPQISLTKIKGYDTYLYRHNRSFKYKKSKAKLDYTWQAHNIDSHSLAEIALNKQVDPYYGLYKIEFMQFSRRQLHVQLPIKGNVRKRYGSTVSMGMSRGSVLVYKNKLCYLGGTSKGKLTIHSIITGKRINQNIKTNTIKFYYNNKYRNKLIVKNWKSLLNFK